MEIWVAPIVGIAGVAIGFLLSWWKDSRFYNKKSKDDYLREQQNIYASLYFDFKENLKHSKYIVIAIKNEDEKINFIEKNFGYFTDGFRDMFLEHRKINRLLSLKGIYDFNEINKTLGRKYNQEEMDEVKKELKESK